MLAGEFKGEESGSIFSIPVGWRV